MYSRDDANANMSTHADVKVHRPTSSDTCVMSADGHDLEPMHSPCCDDVTWVQIGQIPAFSSEIKEKASVYEELGCITPG